MATKVRLDADVVRAVQRETKEKCKPPAVRVVPIGNLRTHRLREVADLAGKVDLRYTNDQLENLEEH